jgi:hypothetical protein
MNRRRKWTGAPDMRRTGVGDHCRPLRPEAADMRGSSVEVWDEQLASSRLRMTPHFFFHLIRDGVCGQWHLFYERFPSSGI